MLPGMVKPLTLSIFETVYGTVRRQCRLRTTVLKTVHGDEKSENFDFSPVYDIFNVRRRTRIINTKYETDAQDVSLTLR
jgi:hypothetical protein